MDEEPLETLTHARLRAAQGDVAGARRVLGRLLGRSPHDLRARALLDSLASRVERPAVEPPAELVAPARAGDPRELAVSFRRALAPTSAMRRIRRLRDWLRRIERRAAGPEGSR